MTTLSPMMRQYEDAKAVSGDALLFFRMGDFYELFHEDAKIAARVLGLTLTSRDKSENRVPMAGFPHHQLEGYLAKLIRSGYRAAVCEQMEDPKQAKGIVKREVTRIVTPGTLTDDALLDPRASNLLIAICPSVNDKQQDSRRGLVGIAWVELSTGRFEAGVYHASQLHDELAKLEPAEVLTHEEDLAYAKTIANSSTLDAPPWAQAKRPSWQFGLDESQRVLCQQFGIRDLAGMGWEDGDELAIRAAGAAMAYLLETQRNTLSHIQSVIPARQGRFLEIDAATRLSLELTHTIRGSGRQGSLLEVMDRTLTPMGARRIAQWLASPLIDRIQIESRLNAVEELVKEKRFRETIRTQLQDVYDLQRLLGRVATGRCGPRDLQQVGTTLEKLPKIKAVLEGRESDRLCQLGMRIDCMETLAQQLRVALVESCPLLTREGGYIRAGYSERLDELRGLAGGGKEWIARYQASQIEATGISSLKIGFTSVFGYYLEVTNTHRDRIPVNFIRKQTLKNAERYITPELKEYEEKVLGAEEQAAAVEYELFVELREAVHQHTAGLQITADTLAELDVLAGLAELAVKQNYVKPKIIDEPRLELSDGRHPVLDAMLAQGTFVPNDTFVGMEHGRILLITGPNMAGKSTYIRQTALLVLMAQMGSFVPAHKATVGIADRIFARVGASDELSRGQSTFMVEMVETARILNTASSRSLVILDEIGRGTSTYDGLSLAWAIVEHLHDKLNARTLFATHYHELVQLEQSHDGVRNYNVAVKEWDDRLVFLHRITKGGADKSYGIQVARLAGIPASVNDRAKDILSQLEIDHLDRNGQSKISPPPKRTGSHIQMTLFQMGEHPIVDQLKELDITQLTPMAALQLLEKWSNEIAGQPVN
ncbi:MAG: DNA mismatch repair protein MutS [Planctomycetota bacterium]|nr:DNA mismatch repair protein MutS [Planctomycetota bacterium]